MKIEVKWGTRTLELNPEAENPARPAFVWSSADSGSGYFRATQQNYRTAKKWSAVFSNTAHIGEGATAQEAFDALRVVMDHDSRLLIEALA